MNKKLREALIRLGLSGDATEEEALAFLNALSATQREGLKTDGTTGGQPEQETGKGLAGIPAPARPAGLSATDAQAAALAAVREERERVSGITALCGRHGLAELAEGFIAEGVSLADARGRVLDKLAEGNRPVGVLDFIGCARRVGQIPPAGRRGLFPPHGRQGGEAAGGEPAIPGHEPLGLRPPVAGTRRAVHARPQPSPDCPRAAFRRRGEPRQPVPTSRPCLRTWPSAVCRKPTPRPRRRGGLG